MKVLVTGATGYVGGRLVGHLAGQGHDVIGTSRMARTAPRGWPAAARLVKLDSLAISQDDTKLLEGLDAVIHLAAANELRSAEDPEAAMLETCGGTRRLLERAIENSVPKFLFLSTIHVYGAPLVGHYDETQETRPAHPYSITHRAAEDYVLAAHKAGRITGFSIRLSNSIGAPAWTDVDRWTLVGNDLARQAVATGRMTLRTPGQWRDFVPMQDVCAGLDLLLRTDETLGDGIVNLGGDHPARIIDIASHLAEIAEDVLGKTIEIVAPEQTGADPKPQYTIGIERLKRLGYAPSGKAGLAEEFRSTFELLKNCEDTTCRKP
jgi:UDP-glucose 4-epimerase